MAVSVVVVLITQGVILLWTRRAALFDPTPAAVKNGRPFLYDAHLTSRLGSESCASCHVDATRDTEAWDLGDPSGAMKTLDEPCNTGTGLSGVCADWHPMKGPMMTQTLIGSVGTEPLHWRGDREDIGAFTSGLPRLKTRPPSALYGLLLSAAGDRPLGGRASQHRS